VARILRFPQALVNARFDGYGNRRTLPATSRSEWLSVKTECDRPNSEFNSIQSTTMIYSRPDDDDDEAEVYYAQ
jgi:hypothetical protein